MKKRDLYLWTVISVMSLLGGCTTLTTADFFVDSYPRGATVINSEGTILGMTPLNVSWAENGVTPTKIRGQTGPCWKTTELQFLWPSGVKTNQYFWYCGDKFQYRTINIARDLSLPGLDIDMKHAMQIEQIRATQKVQKSIDNQTSTIEFLNSINNSFRYY